MKQTSAREFLEELGVKEEVIQKFEEEEIETVADIMIVSAEQLKDTFGLKTGPLNKIKSAIAKLRFGKPSDATEEEHKSQPKPVKK